MSVRSARHRVRQFRLGRNNRRSSIVHQQEHVVLEQAVWAG
jgi:hypothetical protein